MAYTDVTGKVGAFREREIQRGGTDRQEISRMIQRWVREALGVGLVDYLALSKG